MIQSECNRVLASLCEFQPILLVRSALGMDLFDCGSKDPNTACCFYIDGADAWLNANLAMHNTPWWAAVAQRYQHFLAHHRRELMPDVIEQLELTITAALIQTHSMNF